MFPYLNTVVKQAVHLNFIMIKRGAVQVVPQNKWTKGEPGSSTVPEVEKGNRFVAAASVLSFV